MGSRRLSLEFIKRNYHEFICEWMMHSFIYKSSKYLEKSKIKMESVTNLLLIIVQWYHPLLRV